MLQIVHAADFHLDSPFAALGEAEAAACRAEQRALLRALSEEAQGADLVLLAGDLLDSCFCRGETAEAMESFLASLPGRVFLAPGNHDYYAPESPWSRMRVPENVHIFTSSQPEAVPLPELGCTVWGAAFTAPKSRPKLRGFHVPAGGGLQLMVLHGDTSAADGGYNAVSEADIAESGLDYLALGHIHGCSGLRESGGVRWAYPGCLMSRGFDETGEKGFLRLRLSEAACEAEFVPLPSRRYEILAVNVTGAESLASAVETALPADAQKHVFRVLLRGEWPEKPKLDALSEALSGRCYRLDLRDETRILKSVWDAAGEDTLRGAFLRVLKRRYETAPEAERAQITLAARYGLAALDYREDL